MDKVGYKSIRSAMRMIERERDEIERNDPHPTDYNNNIIDNGSLSSAQQNLQNIFLDDKPYSISHIALWKLLCSIDECLICHKKIKLIIPHPKQTLSLENFINFNYLIHYHDTHGIPEEEAFKSIINNAYDHSRVSG